MTTVALIGVDGAGKTTIANKLLETFPLPLKYIYMGLNIESSNYKLPTSRLILYLKLRAIKKKAAKTGNTDPAYLTTHHVAHRKQKRGNVGTVFRTFNRFAEAWYRLLIAWFLQARGHLVLYDRYILFDMAPNVGQEGLQHPAERILYQILTRFYPEPDMVIFLEAAPEILFERKPEASVAYLTRKTAAILAQGQKMKNFVRVDAAQPLEQVYADVSRHIMQLHSGQHVPTESSTNSISSQGDDPSSIGQFSAKK